MPSLPERLDEAGLEQLYVRLEKPVFNVVYRWLWNRDDAAEVVQETFMKLWRMRDRVDTKTVQPLIYRIAINTSANRRRKQKLLRWLPFTDTPGGSDPEAPLLDGESDARVRAAIEELPEGLRRVITLCELSGMTYDQVAETLGIPPGTVGSRRNTAMRKLRALLNEEDDRAA